MRRQFPTGSDLDLEKAWYLNSTTTKEDIEKRAKQLGYSNADGYMRQMQRHGILRSSVQPEGVVEEKEVERVPYPKFNLTPFKVGKATRDQEDIVVVLADAHAGRKTPSYDSNIYKARMASLLDSTMDVINLHRPIKDLYIFDLGDGVQGENIYQGSKVESVECSAQHQVHDLAVPTLSQFIMSLKQGVSTVKYYSVPGNHGRYAKEAPDDSNWDIFKARALKWALQNQQGVEINYTEEFYDIVNIRGFRFFIFHGDDIQCINGIPLFALKRRCQEWFAHVGGVNYFYCGHFHTGAYDHVNELSDVTVCPPLVTGDSWALRKIGRSSKPTQLLFGLHPHYGRTWEYSIYTDNKFLPKTFDV